MKPAHLEHANVTVSDLERSTKMLCDIFGWHLRWQGKAINGGTTAHVGSKDSYVALFTPLKLSSEKQDSYTTLGGLNHLAVVVDDINATEARVKAAGLTPGSHADYEPGLRFYFHDHDGIEYEVVSYP